MAVPLNIVFVLFDNVTQLDFTGPLQVLSRLPGAVIHVAHRDMGPITTDATLTLNPTTTFSACPQADVLCIPGGFGVDEAIEDKALMDFVRRQAAGARFVTSVCTGAFVLGAAGLLRGKRATTHWAYHHLLADIGAIPVKARVVRDGNVFTGGGVTAGIDFAFTLAAEIAGTGFAEAIQLGLEYDPSPPFASGSPDTASEAASSVMRTRFEHRLGAFQKRLAATMNAM